MNTDELRTTVLPMLLSGVRPEAGEELRALGSDREHSVLNALSLAGQSLRFARPPIPGEFIVEHWPRDERRIVPDRLRRPMLRLLDRSTDDTARALALAFEKLRLRPHPFDLPRLDGFVRRYADRLGATAQYFLERKNPAQQVRGYFDADELTAENWTDGSLRPRVNFLRELRKQDPAGARKILEQSWFGENPDSRVQLLSIFQVGLSQEDKQFLGSIQKDRAPRVRAIVHRLLTRLSGSTAQDPALAACMERIQRSKTGLLKKRNTLKLELPANVKEHETNRWVQEQFADVTLEHLARACEMSQRDLVEATQKDEHLLFALAVMASREKRFDLLDAITDELPDAWGRMSGLAWEDDLERDREEVGALTAALIKPRRWLPQVPFPAWSWLHRQIEGPLPASIMREVLASKAWSEQLEPDKKGGSEFVQVICALCPSELRRSIRAQLEPIEVDRKDKGWMLLDILDELENAR
jgi:hypothetical protein